MIRICIVDDQALVRGGLGALLALFEDIEVVAQADDGQSGMAAVIACQPDVLLLDVRMPRMNGVEVVRALAAQNALPPTLLLTTFEDDSALVAGIRAGARGYLLKGVTPEVLVEAIHTLAGGGTYLTASLCAGSPPAVDPQWRGEAFEAPEALTGREHQVLRLMASGVANRGIAQALHLSNGTVRNYVSTILSKLGVPDRTKAVLYAIREGLV